jgi:hypothetical protein
MTVDCETARQRLEDGEADATLAAHLSTCIACAREAALDRRLRAAVAAMPQEPAPDALLGRVMAAVAGEATAAEQVRSAQLSLRPWELGGVALLSLLLLVLLPLAFSHGLLPTGVATWWSAFQTWAMETWSATSAGAGTLWRDGGRSLDAAWKDLGGELMVASDAWMSWICGMAAFALAFYLLLTWRPGEPAEDAHA